VAIFLRNYNISIINTLFLFAGFYFLYEYIRKRQQPHLVFSVVLIATGAIVMLRDLRLLSFRMSGEMFLIALGAIFLFFYFSKRMIGFVFPGYILPAIGIYTFIENNTNNNYMWPSFFILLGLAFYLIYFTAFVNLGNWPLIPGTILILFGLAAFAFVLGIISLEVLKTIGQYRNYILPGAIVLIGVGLLIRSFKKQ
jgi:hypothetical protein